MVCLNLKEADDSARAALTTHRHNAAIWRKCQAGKPATGIRELQPLPSVGDIPKPESERFPMQLGMRREADRVTLNRYARPAC